MDLGDLSNLVKALEYTVINAGDGQKVKQAEDFLNYSKTQTNYCIALMMIVNDNTNSLPIRQAAILQLKQSIEKNWVLKKNKENYVIEEEEKMKIKASILDALIMTVEQPKLSVIYENIINKVMEHERANWQNFYGMILSKLKSANTFNEFHGSLMALRQINKNFHLYLDNERKPLEEIVPSCFPLLEIYIVKLFNNYNDQTAHTLNVILRIFYEANHLVLTDYIKNNPQNLQNWMEFMVKVLNINISPELLQPLQDQEEIVKRCKNIHFKNQKMVGKILTRFIQKHANIKFDDKSGFPMLFEQQYAIKFLEIILQQLFRIQEGVFVSPKVVHNCIKYLYYGLTRDSIVQYLIPLMEKLMIGIVLRLTFLNQNDEKIWREDPEEYVRREEDFTQVNTNNKNIALDLLEKIVQIKGQNFLYILLKYFHTVLTTNMDPLTNQPCNVILKESILRTMGTLRDQILQIKEFDMEEILVNYIVPEFESKIGFSRATACWVFGKYSGNYEDSLKFKNIQTIQLGVKGITQCLNDSELPVRVKAAVSLSCLLDHKEAEDMLRPYLQNILESYIKLMDNIDNEGVVAALESIVLVYHNEIVPYSYQLVTHLVNAFQKLCEKQRQQQINNNNDEDEDDFDDGESELTAAGCLEAIRRILLSPLPDYTYQKIESLLIPVFYYTMSNDGCDYIQEALGILNLLLFNQQTISQQMWFFYPLMIYMMVGIPNDINITEICLMNKLNDYQTRCIEDCRNACDTEQMEMMLGCIKNYIQKGGPNFFITTDIFGQTFYQLLVGAINRVYEIGNNSESDFDQIVATTLYICVIENYIGRIDHLIPSIIQTVYQQGIQNTKSKKLKALCIQVIAIAMYYNVQLVVELLIQQNLIDEYFQTWFQILPHFNKDFDKMRIMYGLSSLLKLEQHQLPQNIYNGMPMMIKQLVQLTSEILELREEEESVQSEAKEEMTEEQEKQEIQKTLNKLDKFKITNKDQQEAEEENDSDFDLEEYEEEQFNQYYISPLEDQDEILYFQNNLQNVHTNNPNYYTYLMSLLDQNEIQQIQINFQEATNQYNVFKKNKEEQMLQKIKQNNVQVL